MDAVKRALFYKISKSCKDGGYAIIDSTEFADAIPEGERRAAGEIDAALKELQKLGYIDIRYARGDMYCVAALKSELPEEARPEEKLPDRSPTVVEVKEKVNRLALLLYAAAAFLGGATGSAIVCLITVT